MKGVLAVAALAMVLVGCSKPAPEATVGKPATPPGAAPTGSGGHIAPAGPNVGGITPVTGDLGGTSGGGVGQAAKDAARGAAAGQQNPPPDDYDEEIGDH